MGIWGKMPVGLAAVVSLSPTHALISESFADVAGEPIA